MSEIQSTALCNLILAQLVYELGESNFDQVYDQLYHHPLLFDDQTLPEDAQSCERLYQQLLEFHQIEKNNDAPEAKGATKKAAPWIQTLAQLMYMQYSSELIGNVKQDEELFKAKVKELEEIKSGAWDDRL